MPISFRLTPPVEEFDKRAEHLARPRGPADRQTPAIPYAKPSDILAFRRLHKISQEQAAALLGLQTTWWNWRENGRQLMPPDKFAEAVRKAGPPPGDHEPAPGKRATQEQRIAALEARLALVEAQLSARAGASLI